MSTRRTVLAGGGTVAVLCLAFLLVATAAWAAAGWTAQSSGTASALSAVACTSPLDGWAVGAAGTILVTSDGGETWTAPTTPVPTTHDLAAVAFADAGHGWAVGAAGTILVTSDGGETWTAPTTPVPTTHDLAAVAFADAGHGWAVGAAGTILVTSDGGETWTAPTTPVPTTHDLAAVAFADAGHGWAVGAAGTILVTSDGGETWTAPTTPVPTTHDLAAVAFADAGHGWAVGAAGTILVTSDGGETWAAPTTPVPTTHDLAAVAFADAGHGWAVGAAGTILVTSDGGETWAAQTAPAGTPDLAGAAFVGAKQGWVVGASGTVLETLSAGIPDVTAPVTSTTGLQADGHSGWRNAAQTVTLKRADAGSGVAATYVVVDGGQPQTYAGPFVLAAPGSHAVSYWSVDLVGNVETRHTGYVNIDTGRPVCLAAANVKARPGTLVRFSYRVQDALPSCGKAVVKITIYRGHTIVKTIRLTGIRVNARRIYDYRVNLAHGTYTWVVTAKDLAGNVQSKAGKKQAAGRHLGHPQHRRRAALPGGAGVPAAWRRERCRRLPHAAGADGIPGLERPVARRHRWAKDPSQARKRDAADAAQGVGNGPLRRSLPQPGRAAVREQRQARARRALLDRTAQPSHPGRPFQHLPEVARLVVDEVPRLDAVRELLLGRRRHSRLSRRARLPGVARLRARLDARGFVGVLVPVLRRHGVRLLRVGRGQRASGGSPQIGLRRHQAHRGPAVALGGGLPGGHGRCRLEALGAEHDVSVVQTQARERLADHDRATTAIATVHAPALLELGLLAKCLFAGVSDALGRRAPDPSVERLSAMPTHDAPSPPCRRSRTAALSASFPAASRR